jgi:hypothetical protein
VGFFTQWQWVGGEELRLYLFFGSAVSSWLKRNTLNAAELSCHDQQQEMAQGGFRLTLFLHNGVYVHDQCIPIPRGFVDHSIVTDCVEELSNDKYFDDGSHVAGTDLR